MKVNKITKAMTIAMAVGVSLATSTAFAVEVNEDIEVIEVRGIHGSLKENLNNKRYANAVVDSISAEDIGKFPDKNVADTLSRVPGVTVRREFGEGEGVSIRGFTPNQNVTLLNGQAVGTAQWLSTRNTGRNFNFEMLSSDMIAGVEVYKSPQADIEEGGLGGTVIVNTRKPLDMKANTFAGSIDSQYSDGPEEWDPSVSGLYSWKNDAEDLGIVISASKQERTVKRTSQESDFGWFGPGIERIAPGLQAPEGADEAGSLPWGVGSAVFNQDRERTGFDITGQWRPNDNLDISIHYLYTELEASNSNSNLIGIPFRGLFGRTVPGSVTDGYVDELEFYGDPVNPSSPFLAYDNIYRDGSTMKTDVFDVEVNYASDDFNVHFQIGTTTGKGEIYDFFTEFWNDPSDSRVGFRFSNPNPSSDGPIIDFENSNQDWITNPTDQMWLGGIFNQDNTTEDTEDYVQLDIEFLVDLGAIESIKTGVKYKDRSYEQVRYRDELSNLAQYGEGSLGPVSDFWSGDLLTAEHEGYATPSQTYFAPDKQLMRDAFYSQPTCTDSLLASGDTCLNSDIFQPLASFNVDEEIFAIYAMASFSADDIRGNFGVRYVTTDSTSDGYDSTATAVSVDNDYSEFLPSLNIAWDLNSEIILRASASRQISRPSPFSMAPSYNLIVETGRGRAGNPKLQPMSADQYDVGIEWYFTDSSLFSSTVFKKDIQDFFFQGQGLETIDGVDYILDRQENGGSTSYEGIEVQLNHVWDNGFGMFVNYTYVDADDGEYQTAELSEVGEPVLATQSIRFPDVSKDTYNLGGFYEADNYSVRINYNWRSEYFTKQTEFGPQFSDDYGQWDAQVSYDVTENISLKAEAINITDETLNNFLINEGNVEGYAYTGSKVMSTERSNGRRFYVGMNFRF